MIAGNAEQAFGVQSVLVCVQIVHGALQHHWRRVSHVTPRTAGVERTFPQRPAHLVANFIQRATGTSTDADVARRRHRHARLAGQVQIDGVRTARQLMMCQRRWQTLFRRMTRTGANRCCFRTCFIVVVVIITIIIVIIRQYIPRLHIRFMFIFPCSIATRCLIQRGNHLRSIFRHNCIHHPARNPTSRITLPDIMQFTIVAAHSY
mmetsp:Transcript_16404/g.28157  ORF Transcript_16404/g.28157 Transcript_16404/m.28157 type:complete len:206 (-) Transcript_16404:485-1102(-)